MKEILQYLKSAGERSDFEIADLFIWTAAKGDVMVCNTIKYEKGKMIEGMSCRISGFIPKAKPGAKAKVQLKLS